MTVRLLLILIAMTTATMTANSQDRSITYVHDSSPSFKSQYLQTLMAVLGKKKTIEKSITSNKFSATAADIPKYLVKTCFIQMAEVDHGKIWTLKTKQETSQKVILYIHGGGYIKNLTKYDWDLVHELLLKTRCTIVVADYPLAPSSNYRDVYAYFEKLYSNLLSETSEKDIIFMGNSAGGGIALGFAQKLRNENMLLPSQIILNSPWLDITMSNPEITELDKKDKLNGIDGLKMSGQAYAAELNRTDYRVSPIYGNFSNLPQISLFIGTHDLFLADCRKLKKRLASLNIPINYFEYPKMFHVWMALTNLKESQHAINQIATLMGR